MTRRPLTNLADLTKAGLLPEVEQPTLRAAEEAFSIRLTPQVLSTIKAANHSDPVYAQYMPRAGEMLTADDDVADPIGDAAHEKVKGLVHRYPDRVLLKPVLTCQVYCRFCFRREKIAKEDSSLSTTQLNVAYDYIATHPEVFEVILTGGDPLVLSDRRLADILQRLSAIPHVQVLRIHSRVPVVDPARTTPALVKILRAGKPLSMVVHANHAQEIDESVAAAFARLVDGGIPLFSQSVLLKGVNNSVAALDTLFRRLVSLRVKPYYLHHPDKTAGTSHFRLSLKEGQALTAALRGKLSGLALPTYVLDIPGGYGKVPVGVQHIEEVNGEIFIIAPDGSPHRYRE